MLDVNIPSFSYSHSEILTNISFQLEPGAHLAVLGESGCGKSTLLHLIYGLLHLETGSISWKNKPLLGPKHNLIPGEPFIKLVAQEFNVMPFISVEENIATHLSRLDGEKDAARVANLLEVVDLLPFKDAMVKNLSGGQKQRVALAKALANEPELLLLDEPFSHIDTFRKNKLRRKLFRYLKDNNISCITATHDSEEALAFADTLLLMKDGAAERLGTPETIFHSLTTEYQAGFFGEVNRLPATLFAAESQEKEIILLPYQLEISTTNELLAVVVKKSYFRGSHYLIQTNWNGRDVFFEHSEKLSEGTLIKLKIK